MQNDNELRCLRVDLGLPAKDMVAIVQTLYPKFDKTMQSKCERGDEYGVNIRPDAMKALYERFAPERLEPPRGNTRCPDYPWRVWLPAISSLDGHQTAHIEPKEQRLSALWR